MSHEKVPHALKNLIIWYKNKANTTDHVEVAYKLFWEFLKIHPFEDGNGRIARLLITYHLQCSGTPVPRDYLKWQKQASKALLRRDKE